MPKYIDGHTIADELQTHPDRAKMNLCVDCPYCRREEWFVADRDSTWPILVECENAVHEPEFDGHRPLQYAIWPRVEHEWALASR